MVHERFAELSQPSVLMVPAKIVHAGELKQRVAYYAAEDPMTLFIVENAGSSESESKRTSTS